jgi:cephalosporin-C deacetylase-like acetyl esterase
MILTLQEERLIDYLETRPDVDRTRIGIIGLSKGGMESWLAAAVPAGPRTRTQVMAEHIDKLNDGNPSPRRRQR